MPFRWAYAYGEDRIGLWQAFEVAGVRQVMRWIPPGEFLMGSPTTEKERESNERQHHVVLTEGIWMADTACTQGLWEAVMGENPSRFKEDLQNPVEQVSWNAITNEFLPKLNALALGLDLVLPTEAQWEYACRAGTTTPFSFGEQITTNQVNYEGRVASASGMAGIYRGKTVPVKGLKANFWGLHQMHGNVWEWCNGSGEDPWRRIVRGGSWVNGAGSCRSAYRDDEVPTARAGDIGFRLARRAC